MKSPRPLRKSEKLVGLPYDELSSKKNTELEKEPHEEMKYSEDQSFKTLTGIAKHKLANIFKGVLIKDHPKYKSQPNGVYKMPKEGEITIGILGDWGTYTDESLKLAQQVYDKKPLYTIHLGDTYFTGSDDEIKDCFYPAYKNWCYGINGSFAMLGNHEVYSLASAYYKQLLAKYMGVWSNGNVEMREREQEFSYFCLENDYWKVIGLDTGAESNKIGGFTGIAQLFINLFIDRKKILAGNISLDITKDQLKWLKEQVFKEGNDKKGIILLTHHEPWGVFKEYVYRNPAKTLARRDLIGKDRRVIWLWGHEHYFSMFKCSSENDVIKAFGRCIGHSGKPVELSHKDGNVKAHSDKDNKEGYQYYVAGDLRKRPDADLGYNGFGYITLNGNKASIDYYDHDKISNKSKRIVTEKWVVNDDGSVVGSESEIKQNPDSNMIGELTLKEATTIKDAQRV